MLNISQYSSIVTSEIDVESKKIDIFLKHNHSRGIAREAILKSLLVRHTPSPYVIGSGFIDDKYPEGTDAKQCDVIIYDPREGQPQYKLNEFVITSPKSTRLVIEVKSKMNSNELKCVFKAEQSLCCPVLGFAYHGMQFDSFLESVKKSIPNTQNKGFEQLPVCIAVHHKNRNYLAIRESHDNAHMKVNNYLAIDFSRVGTSHEGQTNEGLATVYFLKTIETLLQKREVHSSFLIENFLAINGEARHLINLEGKSEVGGMIQ